VQAHAHLQDRIVGPHLCRERALGCNRSGDGGARTRERCEELVAATVDLPAACILDCRTHDASLSRERLTVPLAQPAKKFRRSLHVGEEQRDRPVREVDHRPSLRRDRLSDP
jgi:hypothetical protein